ncbi:MAG: hypothetical protein V8T36_02295 [Ruthenibacterium lactatiformans]
MMDYYTGVKYPRKSVCGTLQVAENEDTEKGLSDFVPFKNLFNEWFAKDTSQQGEKLNSRRNLRQADGSSAYATAQDTKTPGCERNKLVIDEETSGRHPPNLYAGLLRVRARLK